MTEKPYEPGTPVIVTYAEPLEGGLYKNYVNVGDVIDAGEWVMHGRVLNEEYARRGIVADAHDDWLYQEVHRDHVRKAVIMFPVRWLKPLEPPEGDDEDAEAFNKELATDAIGRLARQLEEAGFV